MIPLLRLLRPHAVRYAQRRNDQHLVDQERVAKVADGRQRRSRLAQSHVQEKAAAPPVLNERDGAALVTVEVIAS